MSKVKLKYFSRIRETIGKTSELVEIKSKNIPIVVKLHNFRFNCTKSFVSKKHVEKGFGIDQDNLKQWLSGAIKQHDSILAGKYSYTADFETIKEPLKMQYHQ